MKLFVFGLDYFLEKIFLRWLLIVKYVSERMVEDNIKIRIGGFLIKSKSEEVEDFNFIERGL